MGMLAATPDPPHGPPEPIRHHSTTAQAMILRAYRVTTTTQTHFLVAISAAHAIRTALELSEPGAKLLSCLQEGDW
jgi:hypothetical protein